VADHLISALKDGGLGQPRVEGLAAADWVLIDAGDVIIHVFRPEVREFYNLEKMWQTPDIDKELGERPDKRLDKRPDEGTVH
jgi:ribosome-associated protein